MKKVLVVGCKGMAGHIVKAYLESLATYEVWGMARGIKVEAKMINLDVSDTKELENIYKTIQRWINTDRTTATLGGSPIEWRNRELNHGADTQCNITLDTGQQHMHEHDNITNIIHHKHNLYIQTDGGG